MSQLCHPVFTIGHSNRSLDLFAEMLRSAAIDTVVDVRAFPRSRTNPQFNIDVLPSELAALQIGYAHRGELGGRRKAQSVLDAEINGNWRNRSFQNYADYAFTAPFQNGLGWLRAQAREKRIALMCSEAVWWRCHRRIIADYLLAESIAVYHIMDVGKIEPARMTPGSEVLENGCVGYPGAPPQFESA